MGYLEGDVPKEQCGHPDFFGHYKDGRPRCGYCGKFMDEVEENDGVDEDLSHNG